MVRVEDVTVSGEKAAEGGDEILLALALALALAGHATNLLGQADGMDKVFFHGEKVRHVVRQIQGRIWEKERCSTRSPC